MNKIRDGTVLRDFLNLQNGQHQQSLKQQQEQEQQQGNSEYQIIKNLNLFQPSYVQEQFLNKNKFKYICFSYFQYIFLLINYYNNLFKFILITSRE